MLGDTLVDGRTLWILADRTEVDAGERFLTVERTLDDLAVHERSLMGVQRGTYLYDPTLGLYLQRHDTTELHGPHLVTPGPFVLVGADYSTRYESPGGYAGGQTWYLLETPEGWRVVATGGWIT